LFVAVVDRATGNSTAPATRVRVYAAGSGNLIQEYDGLGIIHDMALSPDGERLALAGQNGARLLSAQDGSLLAEFGSHAREVRSLAFSPDGAALALGSLDGAVSLWAVPEGNPLWQAPAWVPVASLSSQAFEAEIWDLAFSPAGDVLFALAPTRVVDTSGRVSAWQVSDGQALYSVDGTNGSSQPAVSPDGTRLIIGGYEDGRAQVWSVV
jgi:WD40 repeat protein